MKKPRIEVYPYEPMFVESLTPEEIRDAYEEMIDALIDVLPILKQVSNGHLPESELVKKKINKTICALSKAGCTDE